MYSASERWASTIVSTSDLSATIPSSTTKLLRKVFALVLQRLWPTQLQTAPIPQLTIPIRLRGHLLQYVTAASVSPPCWQANFAQ
jgi:hypothetical protein